MEDAGAAGVDVLSAGLLGPNENPVFEAGAGAALKLKPDGFASPAGAAAAPLLGAAPSVKPPVEAGFAPAALFWADPNPEKRLDAGALFSTGFEVLGCPKREEPPPAAGAGLLKPLNKFVGGAEAGVVVGAAEELEAAGVPNEKAGFDVGVADPIAGGAAPAPPKRLPLPPLPLNEKVTLPVLGC